MDTHLSIHRQLLKEVNEVIETIQDFNYMMDNLKYAEDLGIGMDYDEYLLGEFIGGTTNKVKYHLV